jgi:DNA-binding LacI/PurR family transcriptional regulator
MPHGRSPGTARRRAVGLKDIARAVGVSHVSVWNALNRPEEVSEGLRQRIRAAVEAMGYTGPQAAGRVLRTGRAGAVGLYSPDPLAYLFDDPAAAHFMAGVADALQARRSALLVLPSGDAAPLVAEGAAVDGFIFYATSDGDPVAERIARRALPTVFVDAGPVAGAAQIGIDDRAAARLAARHLVALGHRRIAVLALEPSVGHPSGPIAADALEAAPFGVTRLRWLGIRDALAEAGLRPAGIAAVLANSEAAARDEALGLLRSSPRPTAVVAMSDRLAFGAAQAASEAGLAIPGDLSITGFDDIPAATIALAGGLTTVRQPLREKGMRAAAALLAEDGSPRESPRGRTILAAELVVRGSTGPAPDA